MEIIIIIGIVLVIVGLLAYEMIIAPIMPDDYGLSDEERKEINILTQENKNEESE